MLRGQVETSETDISRKLSKSLLVTRNCLVYGEKKKEKKVAAYHQTTPSLLFPETVRHRDEAESRWNKNYS